MQLAQCSNCHASILADTTSCPLCGTARVPEPAHAEAPPTVADAPPAPPAVPAAPPAPTWGTPPPAPTWGAPADPAGATPPAAVPYVVPQAAAARPAARPTRRRAARPIAALIVVLAVVAGAAWFFTRDEPVTSADVNARWETRESPSGTYELEFPSGAEATERSVAFASMEFDITGIHVGDGGLERAEVGTLFVETDLESKGLTPEAINGNLRATLLSSGSRGALEYLGVEWESTSDTNSPLGTGLALTGTVPDRDLTVRAFAVLDASILVGVVAIVPSDEASDADRTVDRIVESIVRAA